MARAEHVAVHLLSRQQQDVARLFATGGTTRFDRHTEWILGPHGVPILQGVVVWLVCRVAHRVPAGDHDIVIVAPVAGGQSAGVEPLLYHSGRYAALDRLGRQW